MRVGRLLAVVLAGAAVLAVAVYAAAHAAGRFDPLEVRLNRAVPPDLRVQAAHEQLLRAVDDARADRRPVDEAVRRRLQDRALECGGRFTYAPPRPWHSDADLARAAAVDRSCFEAADGALASSLNLMRARVEMDRPPLAALPSGRLPSMGFAGHVVKVRFAGSAAVAAVLESDQLSVRHMVDGRPFLSVPRPHGQEDMRLSDNGRVLFSLDPQGLRVRLSERGIDLARIDGVHSFVPLGSRFLLVLTNDRRAQLIDLDERAYAAQAPQFDRIPITEAFPVPGSPRRFVLVGPSHLILVDVSVDDKHWPRLDKLQHHRFPSSGAVWTHRMADGHTIMAAGDGLVFFDTRTLEFTVAPLDAMRVYAGYPTADPDIVLLSAAARAGSAQRSGVGWYLYSRSRQELAPLVHDASRVLRVDWVASTRTLAVLQDRAYLFDFEPQATDWATLRSMAHQQLQEENERKIAAAVAAPAAAPEPARAPLVPAAPAPAAGTRVVAPAAASADDDRPLARLVGDAAIHGIGVVRGSPDADALASSRSPGVVRVRVRPGRGPAVLVLSSQESVRWVVSRDPGVDLKAVLISGPGVSMVSVEGAHAEVRSLGTAFASGADDASYEDLRRQVRRSTGLPLLSLAWREVGAAFVVNAGGRANAVP